jgi:class 3 adenylate cyclase/sensor domain CHASE-containing protein
MAARRTSLRRSALLLVGATSLALLAALYLPLRWLLLREFVRLEETTALRHVERARNAISVELDRLGTQVRDYAVWDDTYRYLGGEAPDYPAVNLVDETLTYNRLSLFTLLDATGEVRFTKEFDLGTSRRVATGPLTEAVRSLCPDAQGCARRGIVETSRGPLLVAAHAVRNSAEEGPSRGVLVVGRLLDAREVARIAASSGLELSVRRAEPSVPHGPRVVELDEQRLAGFVVLDDVEGRPYLLARVEMARDIYAHGVLGTRSVALAIAAAGVVLALMVFLLLDRAVLRRVARLSSDVHRVRESADPTVRVSVQGRDELAELATGINGMLVELARAREMLRRAFGRYVSEEVAAVVLSAPEGPKLGGQEREVTILFSDIRGYSTISEHMEPSEVLDLLNEYFGAMSEEIEAEGGCVIEFLGDAILAVFGAPTDQPDHAERAMRAALAMHRRGERLNAAWTERGTAALWRERGVDALGSRIGLHTGNVVAGNVGSLSRMKYAIIGDAVNTAARVEALNKALGTDLLLTAEVVERLGPELRARLEDRGEHAVKGRDRPVHVYALRGPRASLAEAS